LGQQVRIGHISGRGHVRQSGVRRALGHELEALQEPGWEHRPQDQRGRGQVVIGDPSGEGDGQRRQERTVGPDPVHDRLGGHAGQRVGRRGLGDDDTERLPSAELDEDRFPDLEISQCLGDEIGVGPIAAAPSRVHRDLDRARRRADLLPDGVAEDQGDLE
jgi:hypothetical protein